IMTFSGDPSEFAGGAGRDQFQNSALVSSPVTQLTVPYSTLALGAEWTPSERVAVSSTLMNTADSSTTSGLEHLDDGVTWISEADGQGRLGGLPGGMTLGALYAFDGDYRQLHGKLEFTPGGPGAQRVSTSWAAYWTGWQYLSAKGEIPEV